MTNTQTPSEYHPFEAGAKVKVTGALRWAGSRKATGNAVVIDFRPYIGGQLGGLYHVEMTAGQYKGETVSAHSDQIAERNAKPCNHRANVVKPDPATLPTIARFTGIDDSGEYGNATCAHCGALGRYTHRFVTVDGQQGSAMAGCIKLYPTTAEAARTRQGRR